MGSQTLLRLTPPHAVKVRQSLEQPHEQIARASLGSPSSCLGSISLSSLVPSIPQPHLILVPHFAVSWAGGAVGITNDVFRPCGPPHFLEGGQRMEKKEDRNVMWISRSTELLSLEPPSWSEGSTFFA